MKLEAQTLAKIKSRINEKVMMIYESPFSAVLTIFLAPIVGQAFIRKNDTATYFI
jgi:hypothetical protein